MDGLQAVQILLTFSAFMIALAKYLADRRLHDLLILLIVLVVVGLLLQILAMGS